MHWTKHNQQIKALLMGIAAIIVVASLVFSHLLTSALKREERTRMEVWAEAMHVLSQADEHTNLELVLKVINENNTIPVVVMDANGNAQTWRNVSLSAKNATDSLREATILGRTLLAKGRNIRIMLDGAERKDFIDVCYDDSKTLRQLVYYPVVQLSVLLVFVFVVAYALLAAKRAEQDRVWVGLSRETAHQLGTPISSLLGWLEILRDAHPDDTLIPEMEKDIQRLQLIADRFGKIGSKPEMKITDIVNVVNTVAQYMDRRTAHNIQIVRLLPQTSLNMELNAQLMGWVIENLCRNAVDALGTKGGRITLRVETIQQGIAIEVEDNGRGMKRKEVSQVFRPGFTTKQRGWGLGLSLARRIVEEYHHGKIWVKHTELNHGTTFRIELPTANIS